MKQGQKQVVCFGCDAAQHCVVYVIGSIGKHAYLLIKALLPHPWLFLVLKIELSLRELPFFQLPVLACELEIVFSSGAEPFAARRYPRYQTQLFGQFSESLIQASIEIISSQLSLCHLVP